MTVKQDLVDEACVAFGVAELRPLKEGGQKTVRLVEQGGRHRVMKLVVLGSSHPDALRRAHREVELLGSVDNAHVVKLASELVELGEPVRAAAWLEEYLVGEDLGDILCHQWSWHDTAEMGRQIATGLSALHAVRVVHRDLSANNVRRLSDSSYKIMDPGFARHTLRSGITIGGQPGTPGFMSPEHVHVYSGAPTASSDIFCVGILMFIALTGEYPIPYRGDDADYIARLRVASRSQLIDYRTDLPAEADEILSRCLHPQSGRRYLNGGRLAEALGAK